MFSIQKKIDSATTLVAANKIETNSFWMEIKGEFLSKTIAIEFQDESIYRDLLFSLIEKLTDQLNNLKAEFEAL